LNAVNIPVFSSVLMLMPFLMHSLKASEKMAVFFASSASFTDQVRREAQIQDTSQLILADCMELPAFKSIINNENTLDNNALSAQFFRHVENVLEEGKGTVSMVVLQCSELTPYAPEIRKAFGIPVVDINSLARWVDGVLYRGV